MAVHGSSWQFMAVHGISWQFMAYQYLEEEAYNVDFRSKSKQCYYFAYSREF